MAKFCKECGTKLDEDSKFCKECGAVNDEKVAPEKKGLTGGQIALIVIGAVVAIGIIIAVCLSSCNKEKDTITSAESTTATTAATTTAAKKDTTAATTTAADTFAKFKGSHTGEDSNTLDINGTKDKVAVVVKIYNLTNLEMEGTFDGKEVTCKGKDEAGNDIEARIFFQTDSTTIRVEFTKATWEYIKTGDHFDFKK